MTRYNINLKKVFGFFLFLLGLVICYFSFELNTIEEKIIDLATFSISNGVPIETFKNYTNGILAGGKISGLPRFIVWSVCFSGIIIAYLGSCLMINHTIKKMFSLSYWSFFQKKFSYIEKKEVIRKKIKKKVKNNIV